MHACLAALAMLLSGQVESGRYDDAPAADAKPMFQYTDEAAAPMAAGPSGEHAADGTTPQPTPQPTWLEMQTVVRSGAGIKTDSTRAPSSS